MFCEKCGTPLNDTECFCKQCGARTIPMAEKEPNGNFSSTPLSTPINTPLQQPINKPVNDYKHTYSASAHLPYAKAEPAKSKTPGGGPYGAPIYTHPEQYWKTKKKRSYRCEILVAAIIALVLLFNLPIYSGEGLEEQKLYADDLLESIEAASEYSEKIMVNRSYHCWCVVFALLAIVIQLVAALINSRGLNRFATLGGVLIILIWHQQLGSYPIGEEVWIKSLSSGFWLVLLTFGVSFCISLRE